MIVLRRIPLRPLTFPSPVAAIGIFDGVHRGHQAILRKAVSRAKALHGTPMVITFYPHPLTVLAPGFVPPLLLSLKQRLGSFASCGIRVAWAIPFTKGFSRLSPEEFVEKLLVKLAKVREVVVGHDFGFGHGRSGSVDTLRNLSYRFGFKVHVVGPIQVAGERVASHGIRSLIQKGNLSVAAQLLGRSVTVVGRVVHGADRGRRLGFPTANLKIEAGVLPPVGVYAVQARVGNRAYPGMANIGFRPTFPKGSGRPGPVRPWSNGAGTFLGPLLEVHLFGLRRWLYGECLEVAFLKRLRPERRFPSAEALRRQLAHDALHAKRALQGRGRVL